MWMQHRSPSYLALNIPLSNEGVMIRTRDLYVTLALDTMSKDQLNQKLKLMVEAPRIDLYSISQVTGDLFCQNFRYMSVTGRYRLSGHFLTAL